MKKFALAASFLICIAALFGCGKETGPGAAVLDRPESAAHTPAEKEGSGMPLYALQSQGGFSYGSGCEQGFFLVSPYAHADGSGNLLYIDYATKQVLPLCSQLNCTHRDETCTSWIPYNTGGVVPAVVDDMVLLVYLGSGDYENKGKAALPHIEAMRFNGADRKQIAEFSANQKIEKPFFTDGESLFFRLSTVEEDSSTACIMQVDLSTGVCRERCALEADRVDWVWGAFGRSVVMYRTKEPNGADAFAQVTAYELYLLNIDTQEKTPVFEWPAADSMPNLFGRFLVVDDQEKSQVETVDLSTGDRFMFPQIQLPQDRLTDFVIYDYRDGHLLYRVRTLKENRGGIKSLDFFTCGKEDREPRAWNLRYVFSEGATPVSVIDTLPNGKYLVVKNEAFGNTAEQNEEGITYYAPAPVREYALISQQDYWAGIPNYEDIANNFYSNSGE